MTQLLPVMGFFNPETKAVSFQTLMPGPGEVGAASGGHYARPSIEGAQRPQMRVKLLHPEAKLPSKVNPLDAGFDLYSIEDVTLEASTSPLREQFGYGAPSPNLGPPDTSKDVARAVVKTGIAVEFPAGLALFIWDRSGMSAKDGIHRVAGVVDSDYRGEIKVALINLSNKPYTIKKGDRIAQAILMPVIFPEIIQVEELSNTQRAAAGFGSSGK